MKEPEVITEEVKVKVAKRVPPGDRWTPLDNSSVILESLTDVLEYIYQKNGNTQFYMDAREGFTYVIQQEQKVIEPEPEKSIHYMESIKLYFRTSLIGIAWLIITSLSPNVDPQNSNDSEDFDDLDDFHLFI